MLCTTNCSKMQLFKMQGQKSGQTLRILHTIGTERGSQGLLRRGGSPKKKQSLLHKHAKLLKTCLCPLARGAYNEIPSCFVPTTKPLGGMSRSLIRSPSICISYVYIYTPYSPAFLQYQSRWNINKRESGLKLARRKAEGQKDDGKAAHKNSLVDDKSSGLWRRLPSVRGE